MDGERAYFAGLSGLDESDFSVADHIVDAGLDVYPTRDYFTALSGLTPVESFSYSDHRRAVFEGGAPPPTEITGTYQTSTYDETDLSSYTFAAQAFGAAEANRRIVVIIEMRHGAGVLLDTVTIGGVAATKHVTDMDGTSTNEVCVASAVVPTGTSGDVVVTSTGGVAVRCTVHVWAITGAASALRSTATAAETDPTDLNLTTVADDFCVGGTLSQAGTSMTWTGATERYDVVGTGTTLMTAADAVASGTSVNMNANFAAAPTAIAGAGAAFGPA